MKKLILLPATLLLTCLPLLAADTTLIPALKPITFAWDHEREEPTVIYDLLLNGTNVLKTFQTNEFTITGTRTNIVSTNGVSVTNVISEIQAVYQPGFARGTNSVTVVAKNEVGEQSDPSNAVPLKALGKPAAPSGLHKP